MLEQKSSKLSPGMLVIQCCNNLNNHPKIVYFAPNIIFIHYCTNLSKDILATCRECVYSCEGTNAIYVHQQNAVCRNHTHTECVATNIWYPLSTRQQSIVEVSESVWGMQGMLCIIIILPAAVTKPRGLAVCIQLSQET